MTLIIVTITKFSLKEDIMVDVSGLNDAVLKALSTVHNFGKDIPHLGHYYSVATDFAYDNLHYYVIECALRPLANKAPDWVSDNRVFNIISSHKGIAVLVAGVGLVIFIVYKLHPTKPNSNPGSGSNAANPIPPASSTGSTAPNSPQTSSPRTNHTNPLPPDTGRTGNTAPNSPQANPRANNANSKPNSDPSNATGTGAAQPVEGSGVVPGQNAPSDEPLRTGDGGGNSGAAGDASQDTSEDDDANKTTTTPTLPRPAHQDTLAANARRSASPVRLTEQEIGENGIGGASPGPAAASREALSNSQKLEELEDMLDGLLTDLDRNDSDSSTAVTDTSVPSANNLLLKQPPAELPKNPKTSSSLDQNFEKLAARVADIAPAPSTPPSQRVDFEALGAGGATLSSERDSAEGSSSDSAFSPLATRQDSEEGNATSSNGSKVAKREPAAAPLQPRLTRNGKPYIEGWKTMTKAEKKAALKAAKAQSPQTTPAKMDPK